MACNNMKGAAAAHAWGMQANGVGHDAACPLAIEPAVQLGQPEVARGRAGVE
jgi:hypothetical protein